MFKKTLEIKNETGLHARPATRFVEKTNEFDAEIKLSYAEKEINAKSIMSLLSLGIEKGDKITLKIEGSDEKEAGDQLTKFINEELTKEA